LKLLMHSLSESTVGSKTKNGATIEEEI